MKPIKIFILAILNISLCGGSKSLLSNDCWELVANYLPPQDDEKLSATCKRLRKITAYQDVKEKICPDNKEKWSFFQHLQTGEMFLENKFGVLPWKIETAREIQQYSEEHDEMKPFIQCMAHCVDLSKMLFDAVRNNFGSHVFGFFTHGQVYKARYKYVRLIESLINANVEVNVNLKKFLTDETLIQGYRMTQLLAAIYANETNLVRALIKLGSDVNVNLDAEPLVPNNFNYKPRALYLAQRKNNIEVARLLIENGAEVDAKTPVAGYGRTLLHYCLILENREFAKLLIEKGADIKAKTRTGGTILHFLADVSNDAEIAKLLIENGINIEARNETGETALDVAKKSKHAEVANILLEKQAKNNKKNENSITFRKK